MLHNYMRNWVTDDLDAINIGLVRCIIVDIEGEDDDGNESVNEFDANWDSLDQLERGQHN